MQLEADGFQFVRQAPYSAERRFRADFVVFGDNAGVCAYPNCDCPRGAWCFAAHDPSRRLLVEVQGGVYTRQAHGSVTGVLADIDRLNAATLAGYRMLRA